MVADLAAARRAVRGRRGRRRRCWPAPGGRSCCCRAGPAPRSPARSRRATGSSASCCPTRRCTTCCSRELGRPIVLTSGNVSDEPIAYADDDALARLAGHRRRLPRPRPADPHPDRRLGGPGVPGPGDACCAAPAATRPSRSAVAAPPAPAGAGLRRRAEEHVLPGAGRTRVRLPPHRRPGELRDAALVHRRASSTSGGCSTSSRRSSRTTCTRTTCPPSTRWTSTAWTLAGVQHHHAHIASCLADNGVDGPVIGVAFDGTGLRHRRHDLGRRVPDRRPGRLRARRATWHRCRMPGGAAAIRQPWRMAAAYLDAAYAGAVPAGLAVAGRNAGPGRTCWRWPQRGINAPLTSSAGRLFDAVAALLGVRDAISYEGQAAIELEQLADPAEPGATAGAASGGGRARCGSRGADLVRAARGRPARRGRAAGHRGPVPQRRRGALIAAVCVRAAGRVRARHRRAVRRRVPEPAAARPGRRRGSRAAASGC